MYTWFVGAIIALWLYMSVLFIISFWYDDYSIADIGWGGGFVLLTLLSLGTRVNYTLRPVIFSLCILIWAIRLTLHILIRHKKEDPRYTKLRKQWRPHVAIYGYLYVFMLQGFCLLIVASPILAVNLNQTQPALTILDFLGFSLWTFGFLFESIGDWQLARFINTPKNKGRIMKYGLWRYTRHPNYFGEICLWWGLWLSALNVEYGWLTIISPITISVLLIWISGIPLNEKQFEGNPEYEEYQKETSALIPWFKKT